MAHTPVLYILRGPAAAGKSTWAKEHIERSVYKTKRVNRDSLRAMLDNSVWSKENEKLVVQVRNNIILSAINAKYDVICDDTNIIPKVVRDLYKLVAGKAEVQEIHFDTALETCLERNAQRTGAELVPEHILRKQYKEYQQFKDANCKPDYEIPFEFEPVVFNSKLRPAIQVDIDGTLALLGNRSPYDWQSVDIDLLNGPVATVIDWAKNAGYKVVLMSGRDSECRQLTEEWLMKHFIPYDELHMRAVGDMRKDQIVKYELFNEHIRDKYNVEFVLEDRDQVVELWRRMGLTCFQVEYGNF